MSTVDLDFDTLFDVAVGVGRNWMADRRCVTTKSDPNPWFAVNNEMYGPDKDVKGSELVKYALIVCASCDAQYDCARYSVQTGSAGVIASMRAGSMTWLQKQTDWAEIIDIAETVSIPIQQVVVTVRSGRKQ